MKEIFKNKLLLTISVLIISVVAGVLTFSIQSLSAKTLIDKGYIINSEKEDNNVTFFNQDTKLKKKYPENYAFNSIEDQNVVVPNTTFIHYDNSLGAFKNGVLLNIDEVDKTPINYYALNEETLLKKNSGNSYNFNLTADEETEVVNGIWKISDQKYMVIAPTINAVLGKNRETTENYVELEYVEGDVVKLSNENISLKTIATNAYLELNGGVKIDLSTRDVLKNNKSKLNLTSMIINSNDNIVTLPNANEVADATKEEDKKDNATANTPGTPNNNNNNNNNNPNAQGDAGGAGGSNGLSNIADGINQFFKDLAQVKNESDNNQEEANSKIPTFLLSEFKVNSIGVQANIDIVDEDNLLSGGSRVLIFERSTNKLVYQSNINQGDFKASINTNVLSPDTEYIFKVQAEYEFRGVKYSNDFIQRNFTTNSIGINYDIKTTKEDGVTVNVKIDNTSLLTNGDLILLNDKDEKINEASINIETAKEAAGFDIIFTNLDPNTDYKLKLDNLLYNSVTTVFLNEQPLTFKTLKTPIKFGDLTVSVDKVNSVLNFNIRELVDANRGIKSISYDVYAPDNLTNSLYSIQSRDANVRVVFEDTKLSRNTSYVVKGKIVFDNNLVDVIYETNFSQPFSLDGNKFPLVEYRAASEITNNTFDGFFTVQTNGSIIVDSKVRYVVQNSVKEIVADEEASIVVNDGKAELDMSLIGLRSGETHTIEFFADVDIIDGNVPVKNALIGGFTVNTLKSVPFKSNFNVVDEKVEAFNIEAQLQSNSPEDEKLSLHQAKTLKGVNFRLYKSTVDEVITPDFRPSGTLISSSDIFTENPQWGESDLEEKMYRNARSLLPTDFNFKNEDIQEPVINGVVNPNYSEYYIMEASYSEDQSPTPNRIDFVPESRFVKFKPYAKIPDINPDDAFEITATTNGQKGNAKNLELDDDTIVSYTFKPRLKNDTGILAKVTTKIYRKEGTRLIEMTNLQRSTTYRPNDREIASYTYELGNGIAAGQAANNTQMTRGSEYYAVLVADFDQNQDGVIDVTLPQDPTALNKSLLVSPGRNEVNFGSYISTIGNQDAFNYYYTDIDNAIQTKRIDINGVNFNLGDKDVAGRIIIDRANRVNAIVRNDVTPTQSKNLAVMNKTYTQNNLGTVSYTLVNANNNLQINLANNAQREKVVAYEITIKEKNGTNSLKITDIAEINGRLVIPLTRLQQFIGKTMVVDVKALYDSGLGTAPNQFTYKQTTAPNYVVYGADVPTLGRGSEYIMKTQVVTWRSYNQIRVEATNSLGAKVTDDFTLANGDVTKRNITSTMNQVLEYDIASPNKEIQIDSILPTVDALEFIPLLDGFEVVYLSDDSESDKILNNRLYLNFRQLNTGATTRKEIPKRPNNEINKVAVNGLIPNTDYEIFISADLSSGQMSSPVYSLINNSIRFVYRAKTLGTVNLLSIDPQVKATSSTDKGIEFTIDTRSSEGVNLVKYSLYDSKNNLIDYAIPNDGKIDLLYKKYVPFNKAKNFLPNNSYSLKIEFFLERPGEDTINVGSFDKPFTVTTLTPPSFSINPRATNNSIEFRATVVDNYFTAVNGKYKISVFGPSGAAINVPNVTNVEHNISDVNKNIVIPGLSASSAYRIVLSSTVDLGFDGTTRNAERQFDITTNNDLNINIGSVFSSLINKKVYLQFIDSVNLNRITDISYSIFDSKGELVNTRTMRFQGVGNDAFSTFEIPFEFENNGGYTIQLEFYSNGLIVARNTQTVFISGQNVISEMVRKVFGG
ncbi:MAG: hypothetical protein ACRCUP_01140 [Mycoplasmatales bacterium]